MPTKDNCIHYNWGGEVDNDDRPTYPREYGARCEKYKKFFQNIGRTAGEDTRPSCRICKYFERKPKERIDMCDNCDTPCKCKDKKDKPIREVAGDEAAEKLAKEAENTTLES